MGEEIPTALPVQLYRISACYFSDFMVVYVCSKPLSKGVPFDSYFFALLVSRYSLSLR